MPDPASILLDHNSCHKDAAFYKVVGQRNNTKRLLIAIGHPGLYWIMTTTLLYYYYYYEQAVSFARWKFRCLVCVYLCVRVLVRACGWVGGDVCVGVEMEASFVSFPD